MQKPGVEGKASQVPSGLGSGAQSANLGRKGWGAAPSLGRTWLDRVQGCEALDPGLEKRRGCQ